MEDRVQFVSEDWKKVLKMTIDFSKEKVEITEITIQIKKRLKINIHAKFLN